MIKLKRVPDQRGMVYHPFGGGILLEVLALAFWPGAEVLT